MGRELRKVVAEVRLGRTLHEALSDAADRIGSPDFRWAVLAMQIQAEVGGNLAELLDQVASTMRERARMKGEVKALTAEGRASAMMLVIMVPGLGLVMWVMNPDYMEPLFTHAARAASCSACRRRDDRRRLLLDEQHGEDRCLISSPPTALGILLAIVRGAERRRARRRRRAWSSPTASTCAPSSATSTTSTTSSTSATRS